jgi:Hexokinase
VEGARLDNKTRIGMILGTGSNAAFLERADRVQHWEGERHGEKNVIIDIEWGAFGDKGETRRGIKPCFGTAKKLFLRLSSLEVIH